MIRKYFPFLLLVLGLHILFFGLQLGLKNYYLDDSYEYLKVADNLIEEGVMYAGDLSQPIEPHLYTKRPPGYPVFLAMHRIFSKSMVPVVLIQAILSLLSLFLMLRIFDKERQMNWFFGFFMLFLPAQFIYTNFIMSEILFQLSLMLAGWFILRFFQTRSNSYMWAYQALLCLGILIKPVLYLFVFVNLGFFIYLYFRHRNRMLVIGSTIPIVFVLIFMALNQKKTGVMSVSSIQQVNLVDVNLFYFILQDQGYDAARATTDSIYDICSSETDYKSYTDCLNHEAKEILMDEVIPYGIFHSKGIVRFFLDPGRFDLYNFFGLQEKGAKGLRYHLFNGGWKAVWDYLKQQKVILLLWILIIALVNLIKLVGFVGFLFNRDLPRDFRIFLFFLIGTIAFATGPLGASRFALPFALFMLGGAAYQYHTWYRSLLQRRSRQ